MEAFSHACPVHFGQENTCAAWYDHDHDRIINQLILPQSGLEFERTADMMIYEYECQQDEGEGIRME
jgi:hypothetical protein